LIETTLEQARALVEKGAYAEAVPHLQALASMGIWQLHGVLGDMYLFGGPDLATDLDKALGAYRRGIFEGMTDMHTLELAESFSQARPIAISRLPRNT
jgi:hypothetical protein